jgi:hypothetical protein
MMPLHHGGLDSALGPSFMVSIIEHHPSLGDMRSHMIDHVERPSRPGQTIDN